MKHDMIFNDKLMNWFNETITNWVAENFGSQEAEDPSWSIEDLSAHLAGMLIEKMDGKKEIDYELTMLMRAGSDWQEALDKIEKYIYSIGGRVIEKKQTYYQRLAYKIQGEVYAQNASWEIVLPEAVKEGDATGASRLSGYLNVQDETLRYLLVKSEKREK